MEQLVLIPYSVYQWQSTLPKKWNKSKKKRRLYQKFFNFVYKAVSSRLKTNNNQHIIDSFLNSPRIKLSQSDNFIIENRDKKESIVDFVCALKIKKTDCPDIYLTILEAIQLPPKFVINKNAKAKDRGTWIPFKI